MKNLWARLRERLYDHSVDIEQRIGTMFMSMGCVAAFLGLMICFGANVTMAGIFAVATIVIVTPIVMIISQKTKRGVAGRIIMVAFIIFAIPMVWVTAGGLNSGVNVWFVYELFFITLALHGKMAGIAIGIATVIDLGCYVISYFYPDLIKEFSQPRQAYISICGSVVIVTIAMCTTVAIQKNIYKEEQRKLEENQKELERANSYQKAFLANMSHEIRSPINAVLGMNEMIKRTDNLEEIKKYAANIEEAGGALLSLINDILDFSKIESGNMEIVCNEYDVMSVIRSSYNMVYLRAKEKGLEFHIKNHQNIPKTLYGDEQRIRQVITNLLTNSVKYTENGHINLVIDFERIAPDNIELLIMVMDTGVGISKENMVKMFDSFQRLDITKNRTIEGTGLGLAITRNLVELMNGKIEVKSEIGKGTTFTVTIPQRVINPEPMGCFQKSAVKKTKEYKEAFHAPTARVLVVDDMQMNLLVIQGLLKKTQIQVETALSGEAALGLSKQKQYDVILMDHMMPEMDGIEAFYRIREESELNRDTPAIMLTANAVSGVEAEYIEAGFSDYISKPVKPELLEKMLKKYIPEHKIVS